MTTKPVRKKQFNARDFDPVAAALRTKEYVEKARENVKNGEVLEANMHLDWISVSLDGINMWCKKHYKVTPTKGEE